MDKLFQAFVDFYRRHSESWLERFQYKEAGNQLLLQIPIFALPKNQCPSNHFEYT